jgi:hypothetical protein
MTCAQEADQATRILPPNRRPNPALSAAIAEVAGLVGGADRLAARLDVLPRTPRQWCTQVAPGREMAAALLRAALTVGASLNTIAALENHLADRREAREIAQFIGASALFALTGQWPLKRTERLQLWELPRLLLSQRRELRLRPPPAPPQNLSERQVEIVRKRFARAGWALVMSPALGRLMPVRMI